MKLLSKLSFLLIVSIVVLLVLTMNSSENIKAVSDDSINSEGLNQTDLNKLKKEIDREIGKPRAKRSNQCKVIAFGAKACGGPKSYLIYSTLQSKGNKLKRLVDQYNSREEKINQETDVMSDCMFIEEPKVSLIDGMCKIK
jgi:hypothetical protein